jgi:hypothetical protein
MTATSSSTEKSLKSGLTTICAPPLGAAPVSSGTVVSAGPGKAFSSTENSSSANLLSVMGSATAGSASTTG